MHGNDLFTTDNLFKGLVEAFLNPFGPRGQRLMNPEVRELIDDDRRMAKTREQASALRHANDAIFGRHCCPNCEDYMTVKARDADDMCHLCGEGWYFDVNGRVAVCQGVVSPTARKLYYMKLARDEARRSLLTPNYELEKMPQVEEVFVPVPVRDIFANTDADAAVKVEQLDKWRRAA